MEESLQEPWIELEALLEEGDEEAISRFFELLPSTETARVLSRLGEAQEADVLRILGAERAAEIIELLSDTQAVEIIEDLPAGQAAAIVDELPSDEQADLLGELEEKEAQAILEKMEPEEAEDARSLLAYDPESAGGMMITEYLAYDVDLLAGDLLRDIRINREKYAGYDVQYAFVLSDDGRLAGVLPLRSLVLSGEETPIGKLMVPEPISVHVDTEIDELAEVFDTYGFFGLPVVERDERLVGVVERSAVEEARSEQATKDFLSVSGLIGTEEIRSMSLLMRSRRRLSWLSINILLNLIAASVIAAYQDTLAAVIALAVFLPIISDMSGCSGNQAVAVSIRELVLGLVKPYEYLRTLWKECSVGMLNGFCLGLLLGLVAFLWKGSPYLGLVVGVAMMANTIVSVSLGGLIPLVLKRFDLDPALASGPILTTVTDMCGFFILLSFASALLPQIVGG